ncbi:MAG: 2-C-methyl-D-erythritol 2,4-cyclodiphosphate synthase [Gammaproteobacteria bacterium]|nr:2-C-methyl-D-erythritol 2,4-cyclodiphosphate synthase [Gammaproteobacteria bacterium]
MRIGHGYDAHRLVSGRVLILGGVSIPHDRGPLAHSDGDALIHAICDALLGAAALGDIGKFFPDTQPEWKGVDSRVLLREVVAMLEQKGLRIANVDATIVAQRPRLAPYFPAMRENLAADLKILIERVNVKGTTTEGMGFAGREEGIAAHAVALLEE